MKKKDAKKQYQRDRYHNMPDEKKQKQKNIKEITVSLKKQKHKKLLIFFLTYKTEVKTLRLWRDRY